MEQKTRPAGDPLALLEGARAAAKAAAGALKKRAIAKKYFKADKELVTDADMASTGKIFDRLGCFGYPIQSEEKNRGVSGTARWVVDPLDGTEHFARGSPLYSVAISFAQNGQPVLGVVRAPALQKEYWGFASGGAFCNGKKISVSLVSDLGLAAVFVHPYMKFVSSGHGRAFLRLYKALRHPRYYGSSNLELASVACAGADAYVKPGLKLWDVAPGAAVVRGAGGTVIDFGGKEWNCGKRNVVASNGRLDKKILELLKMGKS